MKFKMVTGTRAVNTTPTNNGNIIENIPTATQLPTTEPVKKPSDNRRSNKPIMEKRRRARINNCLNELKTLILDAMKKDPARHSKLEKADILEMTVKHLENLQRQQAAMSQAADPNVVNKYKAGFTECANEVGRFPGIEPTVKRRLLQHLSNCINGVKSEIQFQTQVPVQSQIQSQNTVIQILPSPPSSPEQDQQMQHHQASPQQQQQQPQISQITATPNGYFLTNGNGTGVQLIPTKLSNGNIAFVVPQQIPDAPLPMLIPIPNRTSSTASAASSTSSNYDLISRENLHSPKWDGLPSPSSNSYESSMDCQNNYNSNNSNNINLSHHPKNLKRSHSPGPLSLVIKKTFKIESEEKPWRPW